LIYAKKGVEEFYTPGDAGFPDIPQPIEKTPISVLGHVGTEIAREQCSSI
jgi:hypothetical protein